MANSDIENLKTFDGDKETRWPPDPWPPNADLWPLLGWSMRRQAMFALSNEPSRASEVATELQQKIFGVRGLNPLAYVSAANTLRRIASQHSRTLVILAASIARDLYKLLEFSDDDEIKEAIAIAGSRITPLTGTPAMWVRWAALSALNALNDTSPQTQNALVRMLQGADERSLFAWPGNSDYLSRKHELRGAAAWLLHRIAKQLDGKVTQTTRDMLRDTIDDPIQMVRLNALAAVGYILKDPLHDKELVDALLNALHYSDQRTRVHAALVLSRSAGVAPGNGAALLACYDSIREDTASRLKLWTVLPSEVKPTSRPRLAVPHRAADRWLALDRRDFLFVAKPYVSCNVATKSAHLLAELDYEQLAEFAMRQRICNGLGYTVGALWYSFPLPTVDTVNRWGVPLIFSFFTEDIYNPKLQREWGFAELGVPAKDENLRASYNFDVVNLIVSFGRQLGKDMAYWSVGHQQFDNLSTMEFKDDGTKVSRPQFSSRDQGLTFYLDWISTSSHKRHWMDYGNSQPGRFFEGHDTGAPATWQFLEATKIETKQVTMMSGGTSPVLAHATFAGLPNVDMFHWQCQMDGSSLQIGAAYVRGASRQYGKKWMMEVTPSVPIIKDDGALDRLSPTPALQRRSWSYGYLAGADIVLQGDSGETHFSPSSTGPELTEMGRTAQEVARFCFERCAERGEPYQPAALLLPDNHGFEPRLGIPATPKDPRNPLQFGSDLGGAWGMLAADADAEKSILAFWRSVFPGHSQLHRVGRTPEVQEPSVFVSTPCGDCFDVVTASASLAALRRYRVLVVAGELSIASDSALWSSLKQSVESGGMLFLSTSHLSSDLAKELFGPSWTDSPSTLLEIKLGHGKVYLTKRPHYLALDSKTLQPAWDPMVVSRLLEEVSARWPVTLSPKTHDPVHVMFSRLKDSWLVTLGNHGSYTWGGSLRLKAEHQAVSAIRELWTATKIVRRSEQLDQQFSVSVPPFSFRTYLIPDQLPSPSDDRSFLKFPFAVGREGAETCDRSGSVRQRIEQVLFTSPGERLYRPEFGAGVQALVFEPNDSPLWAITRRHLQASISEALRGEVDPASLQVDVTGENERLIITVRYGLLKLGVREVQRFEIPGGSHG